MINVLGVKYVQLFARNLNSRSKINSDLLLIGGPRGRGVGAKILFGIEKPDFSRYPEGFGHFRLQILILMPNYIYIYIYICIYTYNYLEVPGDANLDDDELY